MTAKAIFQQFFPAPRRRVHWQNVLPLAAFLLLFAVLCLWLELSERVLFANRIAFLLLLATPWVWWMHVAGQGGLSRVRGTVALVVRLCLVGLFAMLLAEPRAIRSSDKLSVVYVLDISDSIGEASTDSALEFVTQTVTEKPEQDEAGLVVFGRNAAVELPPRITFPFEAINSRIDRDATNLSASLSLAAAMLPDENRGRIVLISDGIQTEGALDPVLDELKSRGINVDVLPIQYNYDEEVWLERLELPQFVKLGETYEAAVVLSSLQAGSGTLVLNENGNEIYQQKISFQPGKNRFVVPIYLREAGYYEYSATIRVAGNKDHLNNNNSVLNYIFIEGEGRILVVTDPEGDARLSRIDRRARRPGRRRWALRT